MGYRNGSEAEAFHRQLQGIARYCASLRGIVHHEREDFLAWCSEYLLVFHAEEAIRSIQGEHATAWLRTVLDHRAIEWLRRGRQQRLHEAS